MENCGAGLNSSSVSPVLYQLPEVVDLLWSDVELP